MRAQQLKNSLLQMAVQGQLVEQDPQDEPASELIKKIKAEKSLLIKEGKLKRQSSSSKQESKIYKKDDSYYEKIGTIETCIDEDIPFDIPESWEWVRLPNISKYLGAGGDKPSEFSLEKTHKYSVPIFSNGEKNNGLYGYTNCPKIFEPSITVSGRGTIGFSCVRLEPYVPIVRLITVTPYYIINLQYLNFVFTSLFEKGVGTSIPQLTVPMIQLKLIPLPPLAEQKRIVAKIESLLEQVELLRH